MVTRTLDPRKLPRLCVGERCKRFHAKTWGRAGGGGANGIFVFFLSISYAVME